MSTLFDRKATESSEESVEKVKAGSSKVDESEEILPMSGVSSKAILSQLWNLLGQPEVSNIQCIIGPLKVHYALCDWGASMHIMMVFDYLDEDHLTGG